MPDALRLALTLLAGLVTGVLSGMFGIGGAAVSNPWIRALGATPIESVGSTLPSIVPSAITGALRYRREGLLHTRIILWTGLAGAAASVAGSLLSDVVPGGGHALTMTIALLTGYTAIRMGWAATADRRATARDTESATEAADAPPEREVDPIAETDSEKAVLTSEAVTRQRHEDAWRLVCIGAIAGLFSGLLGIGGGLIIVPAFTGWLGLPLKEALGTSLATIGVIATPGMVTHTILGHVNWTYALPLAIGVIPGARIGAHLAIRSADRTLRLIVATGLACVAALYATTELRALLPH